MGFSKVAILEALQVCDGDKNSALNYLSEGQSPTFKKV